MDKLSLIATATFGLEAVVAREVKRLGYENVQVENGRVTFTADKAAICRSNLWLRSADRVLLKIGEFKATSFDELFEETRKLPWPEWLPRNAAFPVSGKSIDSQLFSVPNCQAIVKKAVVESMSQTHGQQWFPENGPLYAIEVALLKDRATITVDTSGPGLHKRGYRKLSGDAPLKETLAAAMIELSFWNPDRILHDPFCGTGTIPIEAALMGLNIAPGLKRNFTAESWPQLPPTLWQKARGEAEELISRGTKLKIRGTDIDKEAVSMAGYHARLAGLEEGHIHWQQLPLTEIGAGRKYGCIICNPPYGERLEDEEEVKKLYREMGKVFRQLDSWSFYILTAHPGFEKLFGKRADKRRKLYNGRIECQYYQYFGPRPPRQKEAP